MPFIEHHRHNVCLCKAAGRMGCTLLEDIAYSVYFFQLLDKELKSIHSEVCSTFITTTFVFLNYFIVDVCKGVSHTLGNNIVIHQHRVSVSNKIVGFLVLINYGGKGQLLQHSFSSI